MAKRWTVAEAIKALRKGDKEARLDIAKRFPLFATATEEEILDEVDIMTARQIETRMRGEIVEEEVEEEKIEKKKKKKVKKKKAEKKMKKKKAKPKPEPAEEDEIVDDFDDLFIDEEEL